MERMTNSKKQVKYDVSGYGHPVSQCSMFGHEAFEIDLEGIQI